MNDVSVTRNLKIDGLRLWQSLEEMARIGATEKGGVCRLALTDLDRQSRDLFVRWCEEAGCSVRVDPMGNIFARRPGRDAGLDPVGTGSHLDTQPTGGRFDGVYGVMAGLEVIRTLNEHDIVTDAAVEVVVWTNEEGSRFAPAMVGSGVFAGEFDLDYGHSRTDHDGLTLGGELERIGYRGDAPLGSPVDDSQSQAALEKAVAKVEKPPLAAMASSTRRLCVSGIRPSRCTPPSTETYRLFISRTITVTLGAVMNSEKFSVRISLSSVGVSPSACTSSSNGTEIFPSGRTGTSTESSGFFQTVIRRMSVTPIE